MIDYPYEGDLTAVFEAITIPRVVRESLDTVTVALGLPNLSKQIDAMFTELAEDIRWAADMTRKRAATAARHQET